jgi:hypothetical protein
MKSETSYGNSVCPRTENPQTPTIVVISDYPPPVKKNFRIIGLCVSTSCTKPPILPILREYGKKRPHPVNE